jgi:lipid A ethanolaminephosphotransferase
MHPMGSHGPAYFKRSPVDRKPFQPECTTNVLQQCAPPELVNAYDNSIAYTDHVLAQTIAWLQRLAPQHDTSLLYISDHGESLGENKLYLHGLPYAVAPQAQKQVPMVLWMSPSVASKLPLACLKGQLNAPLTHDHLFHSVLGLLGIETREYQPALDALAVCRTP